jgi:indole-3-glycerol phosphate synthase
LTTFEVDLATTERLAGLMRGTRDGMKRLLVAESGVHTRADVDRLADCSAQAVLVGESLMRHDDIRAKVTELLGNS